ncbi:uncharacterized protein ACNLHF_006351 isoform 2-T3 [Anomaloglossus baeobatrachus]
MSEGNSHLQEETTCNAVDQDVCEKETEDCNEDQKISSTPESPHEQPPDTNNGDFEEQVNEPVTEEEGPPYVPDEEMFQDLGEKKAIEVGLHVVVSS